MWWRFSKRHTSDGRRPPSTATASPYLTVHRDGRPINITGLGQFVGRVGNCKSSATREGDTLTAMILRGGEIWNWRLGRSAAEGGYVYTHGEQQPLSSLPMRLTVELTGDGLARSPGVLRLGRDPSGAVGALFTRMIAEIIGID
jgi:hypothetical protein